MKPMHKFVSFGDVLMRLSTPDFERFSQASNFNITFGGVEINVATALSYMGIPTKHITRFPDNAIGKAAESHFKKHSVDTSSFLWGNERIGIYFLEQGNGSKSGKIVYDRLNSSFCNLNARDIDWEEILLNATWFHISGITPALSLETAKACFDALNVCKKNNIIVSLDTNCRKNLWQYGKSAKDVMPKLLQYTDIVIASVYDMEEHFSIPFIPIQEPHEAFYNSAKVLMKNYSSIKKVATTNREVLSASENHISSYCADNTSLTISNKLIIKNIIDRIGTGDAFAAGFIYGSMQQWSNNEILKYAMASMALKHSIHGDQNLFSVEEIKAVAEGNDMGRLVR